MYIKIYFPSPNRKFVYICCCTFQNDITNSYKIYLHWWCYIRCRKTWCNNLHICNWWYLLDKGVNMWSIRIVSKYSPCFTCNISKMSRIRAYLTTYFSALRIIYHDEFSLIGPYFYIYCWWTRFLNFLTWSFSFRLLVTQFVNTCKYWQRLRCTYSDIAFRITS